MGKMKKLGALMLAIAMIASVGGCGSNTTPAAPTDTATPSASSVPDTKPTSPYPDPSKPVEFSFFADCTWLAYDTVDGIVGEELEKQTGVTFDFTKSTDGEQLNLLIASGDLPDLIMASGKKKLSKLSSSEYCYSLDELTEKYAPDWEIPEVVKKLNASYSTDGKFYMLKNEFNTIDEIKASKTVGPNFGQLHMRDDIYKALGSPSIKNKDEFISLLTMVKEKYPDMIPLVLNMREYSGLAQLVGYNPGMPTDSNGNFAWYLSDPMFREYLKAVNELYRKGLILKENIAYDTDEKVFQHVYSGKAFMVTHYAGNDEQSFTANVQKVNPNASFVQVPLMEKWVNTISVTGWAGLFITKNNRDPETALKLLRWVKEPKNQITLMTGVEGVDWKDDGMGGFTLLDRRIQAMKEGTIDSDYKCLSFLLSATDYVRESTNFFTSATDSTKAIYQDATKRIKWSNVLDLCYPNAGTEEEIVSTKLSNLFIEYEGMLLSAASEDEFNKHYDKMLQEAEKIGMGKLNEFMAKTYADTSARFGTK